MPDWLSFFLSLQLDGKQKMSGTAKERDVNVVIEHLERESTAERRGSFNYI